MMYAYFYIFLINLFLFHLVQATAGIQSFAGINM